MSIYSVYVINRAGGLIYQLDNVSPKVEVEKTFSYPLELTLKIYDEKVTVAFGQRDGIKVGHVLLSINGRDVRGSRLDDDTSAVEFIADEKNYPLSLKFGKLKLSANEKIMLASMFHSLFAISCQLSPVQQSSGIQMLETDTFRLQCMQTLTGIKFIVITEPRASNQESFLQKLYEIYADYALKNPFYSIDMPIRCELFDKHLQQTIDQQERIGRGPVS